MIHSSDSGFRSNSYSSGRSSSCKNLALWIFPEMSEKTPEIRSANVEYWLNQITHSHTIIQIHFIRRLFHEKWEKKIDTRRIFTSVEVLKTLSRNMYFLYKGYLLIIWTWLLYVAHYDSEITRRYVKKLKPHYQLQIFTDTGYRSSNQSTYEESKTHLNNLQNSLLYAHIYRELIR